MWPWTVPWRTSPWSSIACNCPLPLSHTILHRSPYPLILWEEGWGWLLRQGAKCGLHSSHLGKCCVLYFSQEIDLFSFWKWEIIGFSIPQLSKIFLFLLLPLVDFVKCQLKELQPMLKQPYATKWTTLWRWNPAIFGVVLFPKSNPVYKSVQLILIICIDYMSTVVQVLCLSVKHQPILSRWFLKCLKKQTTNALCGFCTSDPHFAELKWIKTQWRYLFL